MGFFFEDFIFWCMCTYYCCYHVQVLTLDFELLYLYYINHLIKKLRHFKTVLLTLKNTEDHFLYVHFFALQVYCYFIHAHFNMYWFIYINFIAESIYCSSKWHTLKWIFFITRQRKYDATQIIWQTSTIKSFLIKIEHSSICGDGINPYQ